MGFWPDVKRGDGVKHHMVLENNLRHIVNSLNGFGAGVSVGTHSGVVRIQIVNSSGEELAAGQPVAFDETKKMCGNALPVIKVEDVTKPFGVCVSKLAANSIGDCIVAGPATVSITGDAGDFAEPVANGTGFKRADTGTARILFAAGGRGVILLGVGTSDIYDGPFAITYDAEAKQLNVAAGYINTNGTFAEVAAATLAPATGTLCVYSEIAEDGKWSTPEIKFATPDKYKYPIGKVKVNGESVVVSCFRVPVAIIIDAAECPVSAQAGEENNNG